MNSFGTKNKAFRLFQSALCREAFILNDSQALKKAKNTPENRAAAKVQAIGLTNKSQGLY